MPEVYKHRSKCVCGWAGPWRWLWIVAWIDYYTLHRWRFHDFWAIEEAERSV